LPRIRPVVVTDPDALTRAAADIVSQIIADAPESSVVAATGRTPMGLYAELSARRAAGLSTQGITAIQLDEYVGLPPDDRRSLLGWMRRSFVEPLGIPEARIVRLPVDGDLEAACARFDEALDARGGIDLAILGVGMNGHLGFNEPPSDADAPTRVVRLSRRTIEANAQYWGGVADVPALAVTIGLRQLLGARSTLLLASGTGKRGIVHETLEGPVRPEVPASFLRVATGDVHVVVDRAAWGER
jgi:glucosamine-6-phosphate deaminase